MRFSLRTFSPERSAIRPRRRILELAWSRFGFAVAIPLGMSLGLGGSIAQETGVEEGAEPNAEATEEAAASTWTEADTRLANHYLQLLQQNPEYGSVLNLLWQLYEKHDQTELLLSYLRQASEQQGSVVGLTLYGHLLRKNEQLDEARAAYGKVLEIAPDDLHALRGSAEINDQEGRTAKALALYRRLGELLPPGRSEEALSLWLRQAALLKEVGQLDEATAIWNDLLSTWPNDIRLRSEIVAQLIEAGRTDDAIAALKGLVEADENPETRLASLQSLARLYEFIGDFEGASSTMDEGMALLHFKHHEFRSLFERWVRLHERFDRLIELEGQLDREAARENPSERSVYLVTEFYRLTANPAKEETWTHRLTELVPTNVDYQLRLVDCQMENDNYEAAAETLDRVLKSQNESPLALTLLRSRIALNLEGRDAAEAVIDAFLKKWPNADQGTLVGILEFAREHYLDSLVERLLSGERGKLLAGGGESESAPMELARFFHQRGRTRKAEQALRDYVAEAEGVPTLVESRLAEVTAAFRELDLTDAALEAIEEAIALAPDNLDHRMSRAEIFIDRKEIEKAIEVLEGVWQQASDLKARTEIDQRLFSLMRGLSDEPAPGDTMSPTGSSGPGFTGPPRTVEEFRRLSAIVNRGARAADDPPPKRLLEFYDAVKEAAEETPSLATRYRAGWWASKLQDTPEASYQLNTAREEAGGEPVVEIEKLLLSLFELYEQFPQTARQLEKLIEIDPDNAREYRERWAEMRFLLGYEDEAIRTLEELAKHPEASLNTLKTLASLYLKQGRSQAQVEVWQEAYRRGNLFEKRKIIKQLSTTLIELGRHEEALKAQLDLIERETDLVQKRKQFDSQLSVATRHFLVDWMVTRFRELSQQHPFDRFYPEALARVLRAKGDYDDAFVAMKRAYYMSGQDRDLLEELGELAGLTKDLKAAIYYRRQLIAQNEDQASPESWKSLVEMMEKDLRVGEADLIRERLESKFTQEADFLVSIAKTYRESGRYREAERVLERLTALRPWDAASWLSYGLVLNQRGKEAEALAAFEKVIEETEESTNRPKAAQRLKYWPVIATGHHGVAVAISNAEQNPLASMRRAMGDYPFIDGDDQEAILNWLEKGHSEFQLVPGALSEIRLRGIEEAGRIQGRDPASREAWVARWNRDAEAVSPLEKFWALRYAEAGDEAFAAMTGILDQPRSPLERFLFSVLALRLGKADELVAWIEEHETAESEVDEGRHVYALLGLVTILRQPAGVMERQLEADQIATVISAMSLTAPVASFLFESIRDDGRKDVALAFGRALVKQGAGDHPELLLEVAEMAGELGLAAERRAWLKQCIEQLEPSRTPVLPYYYFPAVSRYYQELESADDRAALIEELRRRFDEAPGVSEPLKLENRVTLALIEGDEEQAIQSLTQLVDKHLELGRPDRRMVNGDTFARSDGWGWAQMERTLHLFASRRPDTVRSSNFFAALDPPLGPDPGDVEAVADYEQFEMERVSWLLESLTPPERAMEVQLLSSRLRDPSSRLQLARTLESRGLHREAVPVYRQVIDETPEEISPARGFFSACLKAGEYEPALELIQSYLSGEVREPAGMTPDLVYRQHADFLLLAGEIEALTARCLEPSSPAPTPRPAEALPGFVPAEVLDRTVFYQSALVRAHQRRGNDEATLRVLTHLREQGRITKEQRLLAGNLLWEAEDREGAEEWWSSIKLDQQQPTVESETIRALSLLHAGSEPPNRAALGDLARLSRDYDNPLLVGDVAAHLFAAGMKTEGRSLLLLTAREPQIHPVRRSDLLGELLRLRLESGESPGDVADDLQSYVQNLAPGANALRRWMRILAEQGDPREADAETREAWEAELLPLREVPGRRLAVTLAEAWWGRSLEPGEEKTPWEKGLSREEIDLAIEVLPELGEPGIEASRRLLEARPGSIATLCDGDVGRQIHLLGQLGDRWRAAELSARLLVEAGTDGFQQFSLQRRATSAFAERWPIPALFEEAGFSDLAGALYERYHGTIRRLTFEHSAFLASYAEFLVKRGEFEKAERILIPAFQKSIGADPALLVDLYRNWGQLAEMDAHLAGASLTAGTKVRLDELRSLSESERPSR